MAYFLNQLIPMMDSLAEVEHLISFAKGKLLSQLKLDTEISKTSSTTHSQNLLESIKAQNI